MQYTFRELDSFEKITFKNMVGFYREELERMIHGEIATRVLSKARAWNDVYEDYNDEAV